MIKFWAKNACWQHIKFKFNLERYLEEGNFCKYKKDLSKNYLLNFDALGNRDKLLNKILSDYK